ncbi:DUF4178 domain-containing protein [Hymenobacter coccineus]|uniref:Uncharacterized protein n=1 Tax=Hymenobacter coccineus TaxID=1908235 RepID=A0A1G1SX91_9BACT|nr:DUF4178 domain-containing protein [Hymenobacter coccineus]OGX83222.1 hypothetical protein BEN49_12765 [Hymenobacter coccineus]
MSEPAQPAAPSAQLTCPDCQQSITYYDVEGSEYYACPHCHSYFRYRGEGPPKIFGKYQKVPAGLGLLPVGTPGTLAGRACRVVGVVERAELGRNGRTQYHWLEYQIYQPTTNDYAQLAQFNGHWTVIRPAKCTYDVQAPNTRRAFVQQPDATYRLYNRYQGRVLFAEGEFDWDIEGDDHLRLVEFICPPVMLVQERNKDQNKWYRAEHIEPAAVAAAFGLSRTSLPHRQGVGAVQPDPIDTRWSGLRNVTLLALILLFAVQFGVKRSSKVLFTDTLHVVADASGTPGTGKVIVSPSFTVGQQGPLEIDLTTTVSNQWLELPVSLINEQTGQGFEFTKNIEFYHGVEDGESWSEGGRDADAVLSRVPAGRYHLNFYPFSEAGPAAPDIAVTVTADPPLWSNFLLALVTILVFPAFQLWRSSDHEARRWSESDYGPTSG